ncbi:MAG TPA: PAS domain S-box protein [Anaerolineales bacterium]|nr:PAS domain S-box protein [Anaerolineales bacterium]
MKKDSQTKKHIDLYRQLVEVQSNLVVKFDVDGYLIYANPAYLRTFSKTEEEIIGKQFFSLIHEEDQNDVIASLRSVLTPPYTSEHRERARTVDGWRWFIWRVTGIRNQDDVVDAIISVGHDITQQVEAEEQLRQSEEIFRTSFENSSIGMSLVNQNGKFISVNKATCHNFGYSESEFLKLTFTEITHPDDLGRSQQKFEQSLADRQPYTIEKKYLHKNGDIIIGHTNVSPTFDSDGNFIFAITHMQDITIRKQAEEALIHERNRAQQYLDVAEIIILALDENQRIILANRKCIEVLKCENEAELLGMDWVQNFVPEHETHNVKKVFQQIYQGDIDLVEYIENAVVTKDGEERIIAWHNAVLKNEAGQVTGILSSGEDITEKKKAEEAIAESEERFRQFSNLAKEGILIHQGGICIDCNLALTQITGYPREELIGMDLIKTVILPEYHARVQENIQKNLQEPYEIEIWHKDGHVVPVELHGDEIIWQGKQARIVNAQDITERKRAERAILQLNKELEARVEMRTVQLKEANKELEAFSYSVSHDLQAPLRAISGFSQIIDLEYRDTLPDKVIDYFERIHTSTKKMKLLIDGLLDLARLGRKTLTIEPIEMDSLAGKIFNNLMALEKNRQINFSANTHKIISGDEEMISILLNNLIGNAIKYTRHESAAQIEFNTTTKDEEVVFFIADNGDGFNMEFSDKLFQPFQRLHLEEDFEGTGIGLSLVKRIIQHHNGQIWVESEKGKGTCFYFTFGDIDPPL